MYRITKYFFLFFLLRYAHFQECTNNKSPGEVCVGPSEEYSNIQNAVNAVSGPGGKVLLRGGTYDEEIYLTHSTANGTIDNLIEFMPYQDETVILTPPSITLFEVRGTIWWRFHSGEGLLILDDIYRWAFFIQCVPNEGLLLGPFVVNMRGRYETAIVVTAEFGPPDYLEFNGVELNADDWYETGVTIMSSNQTQSLGQNHPSGTRVWIHDCTFTMTDMDGMSLFFGGLSHVLVERNFFSHPHYNHPHGFISFVGVHKMDIVNNIFFSRASGPFIVMQSYIPYILFDIYWQDLFFKNSFDISIQNNMITCSTEESCKSGYTILEIEYVFVENLLFQNNLLTGGVASGTVVYYSSGEPIIENCLFRNNLKINGNLPDVYQTGNPTNCTFEHYTNTSGVSLFRSGAKPFPYFYPTSQVAGVQYAESPSVDFFGNTRTTFEIGPFAWTGCPFPNQVPATDCDTCYMDATHGYWNGSTCSDCFGSWSTETCNFCDPATIGHPRPGTCNLGDCADLFSGDDCNYCDPSLVEHPDADTCKSGVCADSWTTEDCSYCDPTMIVHPAAGVCRLGECSGLFTLNNCSYCPPQVIVHPKPGTCLNNVCSDQWEGSACNTCSVVEHPEPGTCKFSECADLWEGKNCSLCSANEVLHPADGTCKNFICSAQWGHSKCDYCDPLLVANPASGTCQFGNCQENWIGANCNAYQPPEDDDDDDSTTDDDDDDDSTTDDNDNDNDDNDDSGVDDDNSNEVVVVGIAASSGVVLVVLICFIFIVFSVCLVYCVRRKKKMTTPGLVEDEELLNDNADGGATAKVKIHSSLMEIDHKHLKMVKRIGSGGSGAEVFECTWKGQTVAYKLFRVSAFGAGEKSDFTEFEKEVEILASLSHPRVLKLFGYTIHHPRVGLVIEFCSMSLTDRIILTEQRKLSWQEVIRLCFQICQGMEYIHDRKIIHRDLKSDNILLGGSEESVKIMDFGVSKLFERGNKKLTMRTGTSDFMAPEVTLGGVYDGKCDVYSFAIVMYQLLESKVNPYENMVNDSLNIELRAANSEEFRPKYNREKIHGSSEKKWYCDIMETCWKNDSSKRYSFTQLREYFEKKMG